ncbi:hypothetical protein [Actinomycetospora sp. NBRC 106378]|uniref:hypothetical protein n=1 Tax=Actinomycetospora sp. NBRC 106378 TaxID=3032208 RepID=UPI0024A540C2|nr:hypothetical protein [Actinomycetospora sp. NBRC 106378]GLZ53811.1 hypothetical protein Acsp07_34280 [Actinomycetospora sp. NBRC 106378]
MSNPVSAVAGPVISLGFGVVRVPVGLLAQVTGNGGNKEWGPSLAVDAVEGGVRQLLGSLLGDPGLAAQGDVTDARVQQRTEAAERDQAAQARREVADDRLAQRRERDQEARQQARKAEQEQHQRLEREKQQRQQQEKEREQEHKQAAQREEQRKQEIADEHAHEARRTRVEAESEAVEAERAAAAAKAEALDLANAKEKAKNARKQ